jgi:hypothetical protein
MQTRYREAQYFSYYLGQASKWGKHSSKLNEMVIILYSADDGVVSIFESLDESLCPNKFFPFLLIVLTLICVQ